MVTNVLHQVLSGLAFYVFAVCNWFLYLGLFMKSGAFFKKDTEQDRLQYAIGLFDMKSST